MKSVNLLQCPTAYACIILIIIIFQIEMTELQDDGKVKDTDVIFLTAYVYSESEVSDITWTTVGTEDGM